MRGKMAIERDGRHGRDDPQGARRHPRSLPRRRRGRGELKAHGNIVDHEYEIKRDGDVVATVSKKWFRLRDTDGVEIAGGEDEPLLLAVTVAIDEMSHD